MSSIRKDIEQRAQKAILQAIVENHKQERDDWLKESGVRKAIFLYSFFGAKNALLIAVIIIASGFLTFLLFPFVFGLSLVSSLAVGGLGGLFLFILAEILFLYRSFTNKELHAEAVADLLKDKVKFEPAVIRDKNLREKVDKALEYWSLIDDELQKSPKGILREDSSHAVTHQEVTRWLQAVHTLAEHVDKLRLNRVIQQDLEQIPASLKKYRIELNRATAPEVSRQLEKTIADQERQLKTLQTLANNMEKATYQLDSTISSLGTIYSQLLLVGSKDEAGPRINRLQEEISEQVHQLEDITEAMDEVYQDSF